MILTLILLLLLAFLLLIYFSETNPMELCDFFSAITAVWSEDCQMACRETDPDRFFPCHCNECSCVIVEQYLRRWDPDTNLLENAIFGAFYTVVILLTSIHRSLTFLLEFNDPESRPDSPVQMTTVASFQTEDDIKFGIADDKTYFDKLIHHSENKNFLEAKDDSKASREQIDEPYTEASSSQNAAGGLKKSVSFELKTPQSAGRMCPGCENRGLTCIGSCPKAGTAEVTYNNISESCKKCKEKGIKCSQDCERVKRNQQKQEP